MSKDGGPAFPFDGPTKIREGTWRFGGNGMSLRDWFAGQALAGLVARTGDPEDDFITRYSGAAQKAYFFADAMLAEREKIK